ncbi:GldG family protein [Paenibacillus barcinonensis]|uniref:GldG family protein n=1 Tax=Paenibacillus barcinonensis TaxID=198119 RepID=UPI001C12294C|nr:GldG family protein [Paenibacillus barcinonensis]MBU5355850.1 GldG family protein [Paenibacillus barcinonensis]
MKKWLSHTNSTVLSVAVIGIFILLTLFLNSLGGFQLDLTSNKQYTLSDQSLTAIKNVKDDVNILVLTVENANNTVLNREVADMVQEYTKRNSKLKLKQYNLTQEPALASKYGITGSSIVLEQGDRHKVIDIASLFTANGDGSDGSYQFTGEEKLTQALMNLSSTQTNKMVFLTGHEELSLNQMSTLRSALEQNNITTEELQLNQAGKVPEDTDVLAIIGPQRDLSDAELKEIRTYMSKGGKLFISLGFAEDMKSSWKNIDALIADYGVVDEHAVMVDNKQASTMGPLWVVPEYGSHAITDKLAQNKLYPMLSLSIALTSKEQDKYTLSPLMHSSDDSYGETNIAGLLQNETNNDKDADVQGPVELGYAADTKDGKPKAVILGTSIFMQDSQISNGGNRDFILNTVNYLSEKQDGLTIRPRVQAGYEVAYLNGQQARTIFFAAIVAFPLVFVIIGVLLWWRRRRV